MVENPYQSPVEDSAPVGKSEPAVPEPFSAKAARYSLYLVFATTPVGWCSGVPVDLDHARATLVQITGLVLIWLLSLAGTAMAVTGLAGGVHRLSIGTILTGLVGLLLNAAGVYFVTQQVLKHSNFSLVMIDIIDPEGPPRTLSNCLVLAKGARHESVGHRLGSP